MCTKGGSLTIIKSQPKKGFTAYILQPMDKKIVLNRKFNSPEETENTLPYEIYDPKIVKFQKLVLPENLEDNSLQKDKV